MSIIDVRDDSVSKPEVIRFGDNACYGAAQFALEGAAIHIQDADGDDASFVEFDDIDNMILALKKAKELKSFWSRRQ